jgi:hypothetical protein
MQDNNQWKKEDNKQDPEFSFKQDFDKIYTSLSSAVKTRLGARNANPIATLFKVIAKILIVLTIFLYLSLIDSFGFLLNPFQLFIVMVVLFGFSISLIYAIGEIIQLLQDIKDNTKRQ